MFNQQLMNMKIQLKYLHNRTSNIRQDYIRKRYREAINHPLIDFTMRSLYCILPIDRPNFITLSHLFMKVDLNIKVKGYYIKLLHPTNRNAYLVYCWEIVRLMLPIQIRDVINEYTFIFKVYYTYDHPELLKNEKL